jgi:hypothetical protein
MFVLNSKNKLEDYGHLVLSLDEVYWQLDEAALLDPKFRSALSYSLDENGMLWPPIVWTQSTFMEYYRDKPERQDPAKLVYQEKPYRVAIGNNRLEYAKRKGYTHVECVLADRWQDKDDILKITEMEYCVDF